MQGKGTTRVNSKTEQQKGNVPLFFGYKAHSFFKKNLSSGGKLVLKLGAPRSQVYSRNKILRSKLASK